MYLIPHKQTAEGVFFHEIHSDTKVVKFFIFFPYQLARTVYLAFRPLAISLQAA